MEQKISRAQRAIKQLDIRVDNNSSIDKLELADILIDFLDYPDSLKAKNHAIANKLGNYDLFTTRSQLASDLQKNQNSIQSKIICECCGLFIHKQNINFCTRLSDINIGLGTRLYLNSLLYSALIFFFGSALFSVYFIITNVQACHDKSNKSCGIEGISLSFKIQNSDEYHKYLYTSSILGIIFVSIWGIIEVIKNHHQKNIAILLTTNFIQASQFTLMLQNFPSSLLKTTNEDNLQLLQNIFQQFKQKTKSQENFKIAKVNVARNLYVQRAQNKQRIKDLNLQLKQKQSVFKEWIIQRKFHNRFFCTVSQREQKYLDYLDFYITKYDVSQSYMGKSDQNMIVFVTFQQSRARQQIERKLKTFSITNLCKNQYFPIQNVKIRKAPPPEEIKWTNVGFPYKSKLIRIFLVYGISLVLLASSLGITYGLNKIQSKDTWVSILISIVITGINFAIQFIIMIMSKYLNQITQSNIQFNIAFKIGLFQILNVIGVPLLALYLTNRDLYQQDGLHKDIFFIAIFNILPPIGRFIDPFYIFITLRNKIYARPNYRLKHFKGQQEFNKIYHDNDFDLGYEYAYILKSSFFTSFFMSIQPVITLFAVIGLLLMFQVNKFRILYRFYKPRYYSSIVNNLVNYLINLSLLIFGLGMLVFMNWQANQNFSGTIYLNWIIFIIGGFFFLFPFKLLYKCIQEPVFPALKYSQVKAILPSEYDRMNPITKSQALDEHRSYLKQLQAKHQLPQQARLLNQSVIKNSNIDIRKSLLTANDQLRVTGKHNQGLRYSINSNTNILKGSNDAQQTYQKPLYNNNIQSYNRFVDSKGNYSSI